MSCVGHKHLALTYNYLTLFSNGLLQIMGKTKDLTVRSYTLVNMLKQLATDTANGVTPDPANYSSRGGGGDWGGRGRGRGRGGGGGDRGGYRGGGGGGRGSYNGGGDRGNYKGNNDRSSGGRWVI